LHVRMNGGWIHCLRGSNILTLQRERRRSVAHMGMCCCSPTWIRSWITHVVTCPPLPQVAVFDTAYHQSMPAKAYMYGLPYELYQKHAIRRCVATRSLCSFLAPLSTGWIQCFCR
jgi:hypothetical protein